MPKHYHFIGIGGIGMSGIAQLLLTRGEIVSGSDIRESAITEGLRKSGARIFNGHNPDNARGADIVIYSSAIGEDNPELAKVRSGGRALVIRRAEALALLMRDKTLVAVSGSHGKTTTTSLAACLLIEAGLSPSVAIGGILRNIGANARLGNGEFFVAEADESDGSFLNFQPKYCLVTNIDREHLDYYGDFEQAVAAYAKFLRRTAKGGCVFACADDPHLRALLKDCRQRSVSFGLGSEADVRAENIRLCGLASNFEVVFRGEPLGGFELPLGGRHNISNALAVIALGQELKIDKGLIRRALAGCQGARRRLEVKFRDSRFMLIDDYAHHPTEIKATLEAARALEYKRLIAVFQPHRYTRTKLLLDEFGGCFDAADEVVITDIYPAGEPPLEGVSASSILDKIKSRRRDKPAAFLPREEIAPYILKVLNHGDLVLTMGAGDITRISDELAEEFRRIA